VTPSLRTQATVSYEETHVIKETWVQVFDKEGQLTGHLIVYPGGTVRILETKEVEVPDEVP